MIKARSESKPKRKSIGTNKSARETRNNFREQERLNSPFVRREANQAKKRSPGMNALKEINKMQSSTNLLIPRANFTRLLRTVCDENSEEKMRWTSDAITVMQSACEDYLVGLF